MRNQDHSSNRLQVRLALPHELDDVYKLRYEVFYSEMGASDSVSLMPGRDVDRYDAYCDHLVAFWDEQVVGTYRLLPLKRLANTLLTAYSDQEFNIEPIASKFDNGIIELGRSCVHPGFRDGRVPRALWRGLLGYLQGEDARALMGCVSVHHVLDAEARLLYQSLRSRGYVHEGMEVDVREPFLSAVSESLHELGETRPSVPSLPPLMKGYLGLGAKVCGGPAMDRAFATADYLMVLDVLQLSERHVRSLCPEISIPKEPLARLVYSTDATS